MFKLKYKIKKILRFFYKILRVILIFGCIASLFVFDCFAGLDYQYTLKSFLELNGSEVMAYRRTADGVDDDNPSSYYWYNDYNMVIPATTSAVAYGVRVDSGFYDSQSIYDFSTDQIMMLDIPVMTYQFQGAGNLSTLTSNFRLNITFGVSDNNGGIQKIKVFDSEASSIYKSGNTFVIYFNDIQFNYEIPFEYRKWEYMLFEVTSVQGTLSGTSVTFNSSPITFYLGSEEGAPLYPGYDDSKNDDLASSESELMENSQEGFDSFDSLRGEMNGILGSGSFLNGALFVTHIYNNLTSSLPWFNSLLKVSLVLGLFLFLLTSTISVVKRSGGSK